MGKGRKSKKSSKSSKEQSKESLKMSVEQFLSSALPTDGAPIEENSSPAKELPGDRQERESNMNMEKLENKDPEFHKFLAQNDPSLLEFSSDEEEEEPPAQRAPKPQRAADDVGEDVIVLTTKALKLLEQVTFEQHSVVGLRQLVQAFAAGCHLSDEVEAQNNYKFAIKDSAVYNQLMNIVVNRIHEAFDYQFRDVLKKREKNKSANTDKKVMYSASSKWSKLKAIVKSFLANYIHMLDSLTDKSIIDFGINALSKYVPLVAPLENLAKRLLKKLLDVWSSATSENTRLTAFLRVRQLVLESSPAFTEQAMKSIYLSYVRNSKFVNELTKPNVDLMGRCVVELYSMDLKTAYQCAFMYIRQLAIHVRGALKDTSKDAVKNVHNWQFLNCVRVWTSLLIAFPKETELKPLVYPLVQIVLSCMRMLPVSRYLPFRFHCIEVLIGLSAATEGTLVPIVPFLMASLQDSSLHTKNMGSTKRPPKLAYIIKTSDKDAKSAQFKDIVVTRSIELLNAYLDVHRYSISFPEISAPAIVGLRRFLRTTRNSRWRQQAKAFVLRLERVCTDIKSRRSSVDFSPKDLSKCAEFMAGERTKAKTSKIAKSFMDTSNLKRKLEATESNKTQSKGKFNKLPKRAKVEKPVVAPSPVTKSKESSVDEDDIVEDIKFSSDEESSD